MNKKLSKSLSSFCVLLAGGLFLSGCGEDAHVCVFDQEVATEAYLCRKATCTHAAKYYYSCACGKKGSKKFDHGEPSEHNFTLSFDGEYKSAYLVGETFDPTGLTAKLECENCGEEIQFVPDFEPEIENSISDVLSDVADQIEELLGEEYKPFPSYEDLLFSVQ